MEFPAKRAPSVRTHGPKHEAPEHVWVKLRTLDIKQEEEVWWDGLSLGDPCHLLHGEVHVRLVVHNPTICALFLVVENQE